MKKITILACILSFAGLLHAQEAPAAETAVSDERNKRFLGRKVRLLTEEISRTDPSMLTGRGDPARPVHFSGDPSLIGSFVDVEITEAGAFSLTGKIV